MLRRKGRTARVPAVLRRLVSGRRRDLLLSDPSVLLGLAAVTVAFTLLGLRWPRHVPLSAFSLVLLVGGFLLTVRSFVFVVMLVAAAVAARQWHAVMAVPEDVVLILVSLLAALLARGRSGLGVQGNLGQSMLVDLRDRLRSQGELPPLPRDWEAEVVMRSAGGASFGGDFLVATLGGDGRTLQVVLCDVSGKGVAAGSRALLLSGAFGGLLGSLPPDKFFEAANDWLLRQRWDEGFATAVHVAIDLETGEYTVTTAGHPPATQFLAGSGRWRVHNDEGGPVLGLLPGATFVGAPGRLGRGDALLLYTDGLVEVPGRDLAVGIDRLLGEAERLVTRGFRHGARKLIDAVASGESDDRALVLLWRT
ncbi:MAG: PP2C family protein-serine/threonine phosphatase [Actinomycetes bacterium]